MNLIALKMLVGDRAKYIGIIVGITFAALLITQQMAIFLGLMSRTFGFLTDTGLPDIWVMDPKVQFVDDIKPLQETQLLRVRGVEGVEWAMPLYKGLIRARLDSGDFQTCNVIGVDDGTLVGGPGRMVEGTLSDLRRAEGVIVDTVGAHNKLARTPHDAEGKPIPGAAKIPLRVGDAIELNDKRAVVVGICEVERTFQSNPVVYTTYTRAMQFAPRERKLMSFVLVKARDGQGIAELAARIRAETGLEALPREAFKKKTYEYFMKYTGIPINFGIAVVLGFFVGTAIAGQTFYNFTLDNLKHFGALKAMGAGNLMLLRMILLQAALVGLIGYGIGVGAASSVGLLAGKSELAFYMPWQLLVGTGVAIALICMVSAALAVTTVMRLEPGVVFKG
jgi:putative ABC transport system permease protein